MRGQGIENSKGLQKTHNFQSLKSIFSPTYALKHLAAWGISANSNGRNLYSPRHRNSAAKPLLPTGEGGTRKGPPPPSFCSTPSLPAEAPIPPAQELESICVRSRCSDLEDVPDRGLSACHFLP